MPTQDLTPEEFWDEFSDYIDDDIDSLSTIVGRSVITKAEFEEAMTAYAAQECAKVIDELAKWQSWNEYRISETKKFLAGKTLIEPPKNSKQ